MSTKTQVQQYAQTHESFTARQVADDLGLNINTVRSAIASLVTDNELTRAADNSLAKKVKVTRVHSKPKIMDILRPKFAAALRRIDIVIDADATPDDKRDQKARIKAALDQITFGNTVVEISGTKDFTKYSESHLNWYKSQYLRDARAALAVNADVLMSDVG